MSLGAKKSAAETSFDEALTDFREFLLSQKLFTQLIWIFSEDVIFEAEHIYIKTPISNKNEALAKDCYELGQKRNFGISLQAFCLFESQLCCYIYLPENDIDDQYSLMSNAALKYSVRTNLKEAESVSNVLKWKMMKLQNPKSNSFCKDNHIPSRISLMPEFRVYAPTI